MAHSRPTAFLAVLIALLLPGSGTWAQTAESSTRSGAFQFSEDWRSRQALVPVALGSEAADLVVRGGQVFIAQTGELLTGWVIATKGRRIAYFGPENEKPKAAPDREMIDTLIGPETTVIDIAGQTAVPGFGHSHNHIESSRLSPDRYAQVVLPLGTTWMVEGDHETGNVLGVKGVTFWLDMQPSHFKVFPAVTSAVPPSDEVMEPTGGWFGYEATRSLFDADPRIRSVGEVMFEPGIQDPTSKAYPRLQQVLQAGWDAREAIQGHTGLSDYSNLSTFRDMAVRSNHNPHGPTEGTNDHIVRMARLGFWTDNPPSREEFGAVVRGVYASEAPYAASYVTLSTDDRALPELMELGDIDHNVRRYIEEAWSAIEAGQIDVSRERVVVDAFRAASYNAAQLLHMEDEVGSFSPGAFADVVVLQGQSPEEMARVEIDKVVASGTLVVDSGALLSGVEPKQEPPAYSLGTVALRREVKAEDFAVAAPSGREEVTAWLWRPFDFRERPDTVALPVADGVVRFGAELGAYKMAAIERHESFGPEPAAELQMAVMFTATSPKHPCAAIASTIQHDAHQLTIHGSCDEAMAQAANRLVAIGGGFVVVADGEVKAEASLPITGMMSNEAAEVVLEQLRGVRAASDELGWAGYTLEGHPMDRLTFWYLTPAPWRWNLTTRGFFDLISGEKLEVVW